MKPVLLAALSSLLLVSSLTAEDGKPLVVNVHNFKRAETDHYFTKFVKEGSLGGFSHERDLAPIDHQAVIRMNRDTLYSYGVFDLDASPVKISLPESGKRYMAAQIVDEDHYTPAVYYAPSKFTLTKEKIGTRYVGVLIRTFVNPNSPEDVKEVHGLQDALKVELTSKGTFEPADWDGESLKEMRDSLLTVVKANGTLNSEKMFGPKDEVDPIDHLLGTAAGWGGNPLHAASYVGSIVKDNDGKIAYTLTLKDVPVDGFWSVSVYNEKGFFEANPQNAYTMNNVTAHPSADGTVTIHFGGNPNAENYIHIMPGWNYLVRFYRPKKELLDGSWKLPDAVPVK